MKKYDVYGMGHALVDMEFDVDSHVLEKFHIKKGVMGLVDDAFQQKVIDSLENGPAHFACGGSAANTIMALSTLGVRSFYSCKVADDQHGRFYFNDLLVNNIATNLSEGLPSGTTGRCLVLITPDGERTMNTFLGITSTFSRDQLVLEALAQSRYLYIGGYLLSSKEGVDAVLMAMKRAREAGVCVAITLADPNLLTHYQENFNIVLKEKVDLLFCNTDEAMIFCQTPSLKKAFESLKKVASSFVITQGPQGAILWDGSCEVESSVPTKSVAVVNTNGAGDLFAGSFLYGIISGKSFKESGRFACTAATKLVTQPGPRLDQRQLLALKEDHL